MVRSLEARGSRRHRAGLNGAKTLLRDLGPWLAVIAGFAAMALLIDFCFACVQHAIH